ncbi:hypothetical protein FE257_011858 [Aspergillus nanangensis]|uniref:DUF7053 domain-containing protein n=1 Tax=Aspergillus nanangensis TaxID=2582783 RepID=A0AAD4CGX8_ASPNN|nr:hypothetical protein FE257_011858 [Aspergillus nanangensis]
MAADPVEKKHVHFMQWALSNGFGINGVTAVQLPDRGLGMVATRVIEEDEDIVTVPSSFMLTIDYGFFLEHNPSDAIFLDDIISQELTMADKDQLKLHDLYGNYQITSNGVCSRTEAVACMKYMDRGDWNEYILHGSTQGTDSNKTADAIRNWANSYLQESQDAIKALEGLQKRPESPSLIAADGRTSFSPADEFHCTWYELTDRISYLPGGLVKGNVSYKACFYDLPRGLQTHVYAPTGLDIRDKWSICGNMLGEEREPVELGIPNAPREGLYLREDVDMRCQIWASTFVKKTLKKAHGVLVDRLVIKADMEKQRMSRLSGLSGISPTSEVEYSPVNKRISNAPSAELSASSQHPSHIKQKGHSAYELE